MNQKKFINITLIAIVILLAGISGYFILLKKSLAPINGSELVGKVGAKNCGIERKAYDNWEMRQCIIDAFNNSCTPAYARSKAEGVIWEASGWDNFIEVKSIENGECVLSYFTEGAGSFGSYKNNGDCRTVAKGIGAQNEKGNKWYILELSNCEGSRSSAAF